MNKRTSGEPPLHDTTALPTRQLTSSKTKHATEKAVRNRLLAETFGRGSKGSDSVARGGSVARGVYGGGGPLGWPSEGISCRVLVAAFLAMSLGSSKRIIP